MSRINFIFFIKHPQQTYIQAHQHGCHELVYYFRGQGVTQIGRRKYNFQDNSFAIISPHVLHDEHHVAEESDVLCIGFHSSHVDLKDLKSMYEDDNDQTIGQFLLRMKQEFTQKRDGYSDMLNLMVEELTIHLQRLIGLKGIPQPQEDQLQYVINFMDEHYQQDVSVESLAIMSGYSYGRFRHLFKEKMGIAPLRYIFLKRIEFAKSLLLGTKMRISDIASETGFVNDAQFCSIFKRETGLTPKTFRNKCL
ncbi:AraC family transcriptional regulator [Cohnella silvisoli]|uniref:AraC family transcriptional regulator n=1 Tax=Cohnella silvisoli TaxID=2873699 RepID=A0ABV1KZ30_9BACL|nr:AraC family transcriptional regulator [Cohnella silvisoli]MCD9024246.1 AraC family transcriptional regulator [Cohnella silvisoli]